MLEKIEKFKNLVMNLGLPVEDIVLFGVLCPYCGKNDRIRPLEQPGNLKGELEEVELTDYQELWIELLNSEVENNGLAVCKFCQNVTFINSDLSAVKPLY
ncbi:MAG TPA: hypothetical protein VEC37_01910 [Bacillota bacterium]|nr:hypothetical protein [Bacillota bacterium]